MMPTHKQVHAHGCTWAPMDAHALTWTHMHITQAHILYFRWEEIFEILINYHILVSNFYFLIHIIYNIIQDKSNTDEVATREV